MKKLLFLSVVLVSIVACKPKPEEPVIPGDPSSKPNWQAVINPEFPSSMTITCLPPAGETVTTDDEVAAFWGDTCRAVAGQANGIFYIVINGPQNTLAMDVKYYSATYKTIRTAKFTYTPEANVGSTDAPYRLDFTGAVATPKRITLTGVMPGDDEASSPRRINIGNTVDEYGNLHLFWREGDQIRLQYNSDYIANLTLSSGADSRYGKFTVWVDPDADLMNYYVVYPTSASFTIEPKSVSYTLPAEQTYVAVNFADDLMPAYGSVEIDQDATYAKFDFTPLATLLQLNLKSDSGVVVKSITISTTVNIAGDMVTDLNSTNPTTSPTQSGSKSKIVTLNCGSGVTLNTTPTPFNIVLPSVNLPSGMTITIHYNSDKAYSWTTKTQTLTHGGYYPSPEIQL